MRSVWSRARQRAYAPPRSARLPGKQLRPVADVPHTAPSPPGLPRPFRHTLVFSLRGKALKPWGAGTQAGEGAAGQR